MGRHKSGTTVVGKVELMYSVYKSLPKRYKLRKYMVKDIMDMFFDTIAYNMEHGERTHLVGFGTFYPLSELTKKETFTKVIFGKEYTIKQCVYRSKSFNPSTSLRKKVLYGDYDIFKKYNSVSLWDSD